MVLDFHGIFKSGWLSWRSGAKERYGFARPRGREYSWLFANRRAQLPEKMLNRIQENLALCREFGVTGTSLDVTIALPDEVEAEVTEYLERAFDGGKRLVAVHAPVDRAEKQWPLPYFAKLVDLLLSDGRFEVLLTWGPGQRGVVEHVLAMARRHPEVAPETPTLKHLASLLQQVDLFLGGDTGPMHMASAMDTPVVAIFGGTNPAQHAPLRAPSEHLFAGPAAVPRRIPLEQAQRYLAEVTPEAAYEACLRLLSRRST